MKTVAYLRVSTASQDLANQKLAVLECSRKHRFTVDEFIESRISSRKSPIERRIDEMLGTLQPDLRTKVMIALFGLFAEVERDLISERTKEGLAAAKAQGKLLGRPKGALGKSRLDGKEQDIRVLLGKNVSKVSIAKILDVSRSALYHFIETRKIVPS